MNKKYIIVLHILLLILLGGCSFKSDFYGKYKDKSNTYEGYVDFGATSGKISIWSNVISEICNGDIKYNKGEMSITGVSSGTSELTCSTGKTLKGQWFIPNSLGYIAKGQFVDSKGDIIHFIFGENIGHFRNLVNSPNYIQQIPKQHFTFPPKTYQVKTGTGFFITKDGYLITNHHVISGASKVYIKQNGKQYIAQVIDKDEENDLAVLKINIVSNPIPLFSGDEIQKGTQITSFGYPLIGLQGNELKTTFGFINSVSGYNDDKKYYQIDTPIQPGNSGGPIINYYGEAVGIVTSTLNQQNTLMTQGTFTQNVNYAVKINRLLPMLKKNNIPVAISSNHKKLNEVQLVNHYEESVVLIIAH